MVRKIRVFVREVPRLVLDVLGHAINSQPDMELIADRSPMGPVPDDPAAPDVVLIGDTGGAGTALPAGVLRRWPRSHVLMLALDGHRAAMHMLKPEQVQLGELSPTEIVDSIRRAMRQRSEVDESDPRS